VHGVKAGKGRRWVHLATSVFSRKVTLSERHLIFFSSLCSDLPCCDLLHVPTVIGRHDLTLRLVQ